MLQSHSDTNPSIASSASRLSPSSRELPVAVGHRPHRLQGQDQRRRPLPARRQATGESVPALLYAAPARLGVVRDQPGDRDKTRRFDILLEPEELRHKSAGITDSPEREEREKLLAASVKVEPALRDAVQRRDDVRIEYEQRVPGRHHASMRLPRELKGVQRHTVATGAKSQRASIADARGGRGGVRQPTACR